MDPYKTLGHWNSSSREGWYNTPGTSPYELNTHVSVGQGPSWGPKGRIGYHQSIYKQKLSKGEKVGICVGIGVILVFLLWYFLMYKKGMYY